MQDSVLLHFNKFYLVEFFNYVQSFSEKYLSESDFRLVVNNLNAQSDIMIGHETLANEQGTSELSIFLFDFIERMADYPPTLVYDSLPEMAEDFVNTVKVMMEEGESREAIEKVNELLGYKTCSSGRSAGGRAAGTRRNCRKSRTEIQTQTCRACGETRFGRKSFLFAVCRNDL